MFKALDQAGCVATLFFIFLMLTAQGCGLVPQNTTSRIPPEPNETAAHYAARIDQVEAAIQSDPSNPWNLIELGASAAGLTGLSYWIRRVKQNGYKDTQQTKDLLQTQIGALYDRISQLEAITRPTAPTVDPRNLTPVPPILP